MQQQNFSVNDGNGIRTTIFLAGCPLNCQWCANPEGLDTRQKIAHYEKLCINCGLCKNTCPLGLDLKDKDNYRLCTSCGLCSVHCPSGARSKMLEEISLETLVENILEHNIFFQNSQGGVTFSGGEPSYQKNFLNQLSKRLYDEGLHLAIETSAYFNYDSIMENILNRMDQIFVDIKSMDPNIHKQYTGVSNSLILDNIKKINHLNKDLIIRIPLIMEVNASKENIFNTCEFIEKNISSPKLELLTYHKLGQVKYDALGINKNLNIFSGPSDQYLQELYNIANQFNIELVSFN